MGTGLRSIYGPIKPTDQSMEGKVVLITGANAGIGKWTALDLNLRGAKVYMLCRNAERGQSAIAEMVKAGADESRLVLRIADLANFATIRKFAEEFAKEESVLDVLFNNAGIAATLQYQKTIDGHETTWQSNHLGHFLLTELLLPMLKRAKSGRIVIVSSMLHAASNLPSPLSAMDEEREFGHYVPYNRTKLANVMHCRELSRRLVQAGISNVTVNCLHPGAVNTSIVGPLPSWHKTLMQPFRNWFFLTEKEGARTQIYLATSAQVDGVTGKYFNKCREERPSAKALNEEKCRELYDYSWEVCGLKKE